MKSSPARGCLCGSRSLKLVVPTGEPGCVSTRMIRKVRSHAPHKKSRQHTVRTPKAVKTPVKKTAAGSARCSETLATGRFLRLLKQCRWEYAVRVNARGAVAIIAVTTDRRLVLAEQFRVPFGRSTRARLYPAASVNLVHRPNANKFPIRSSKPSLWTALGRWSAGWRFVTPPNTAVG